MQRYLFEDGRRAPHELSRRRIDDPTAQVDNRRGHLRTARRVLDNARIVKGRVPRLGPRDGS